MVNFSCNLYRLKSAPIVGSKSASPSDDLFAPAFSGQKAKKTFSPPALHLLLQVHDRPFRYNFSIEYFDKSRVSILPKCRNGNL